MMRQNANLVPMLTWDTSDDKDPKKAVTPAKTCVRGAMAISPK